ncbi:probable crossover junction endonuclease EME2, partial [Talpa occidentalis]|uniref:probable crossover junction endonuclease EME2 n=1 Tax=Talpa occidentalis TaxID=50954 RepID=UPI00188EABBC
GVAFSAQVSPAQFPDVATGAPTSGPGRGGGGPGAAAALGGPGHAAGGRLAGAGPAHECATRGPCPAAPQQVSPPPSQAPAHLSCARPGFAACSSEQERPAVLADLPVKAGARPRRVGSDLSRRICLLLTSTHRNLLLDLGSSLCPRT